MSEALLHFAVPLFFVALIGQGRRRALVAGFFGLMPDLDVLFRVHRSASHSLVVLSIAIVLSYALLWRTRSRYVATLFLLGTYSHVLLDVFTGYTPILWPVWDSSVFLVLDLNALFAKTPDLELTARVLVKPVAFNFLHEPFRGLLFTGEGLLIFLFLGLPLLARYVLGIARSNTKANP